MNLERLHSPQPLRDADFAAIRARVRAKIRTSRERGGAWRFVFRFAFAAMLTVLFVPFVKDDVPNVPIETKPVQIAKIEEPPTANRQPPTKRHRARPQVHDAQPQLATRIEIHTADPDIRIIWIVQPATKERS